MKWFKHYCNVEFSEALSVLESKYGFEGLGRYWRFVEFLGREFDGETINFKFERSKLRALFRFRSWNDLESFADHLTIIPGIDVKRMGNVYEIKAPILLELQSRDFKKTRSDRTPTAPKIKIKNKIKNNIKNIKKDFLSDEQIENYYQKYLRKGAKKSGNEKLSKVIKNQAQLDQFEKAFNNYLNLCLVEEREQKYIKGWLVFVNNFEDYVDIEPCKPERKLSANEKLMRDFENEGRLKNVVAKN